MPNGQGQRAEDEQDFIIKPMERDGWEPVSKPDWITVPDSIKKNVGKQYKYEHYRGDTFVYKVVSSVHGNSYHVFRKLKSDYHETTPEEGTCPDCQSYVKRYDDDDYLTCHRCGWKYKPIGERLKNLFSL